MQARHRASRGCLGLGRLLFALALVEVIAAAARAIFDPESIPIVVIHLAALTRTICAALGLVFAARLMPHARKHGQAHFVVAAFGAFALAALAASTPFFALVPESLGETTWDSLNQIVRAVGLIAGACLTLMVARGFAQRDAHELAARHLMGSMLPLLVCLPVAFQAIDPMLLPSPWLGPALALGLPLALVPVGLMQWHAALWTLLGLVALGGMVLFGQSPAPSTLSALAVVGVFPVAAIAASGALHTLAPSLVAARSSAVSRTLIRRLFDGTLGGGSSRVGDLDPDEPDAQVDEEAAHLARTYQELGIEPPGRAGVDVPLASSTVPAVIEPFVPKSRELARAVPSPHSSADEERTPERACDEVDHGHDGHDGRLAAVLALPVAWTGLTRGLRLCFAAFVARVIVVVFGLMWSASPLAELAVPVLLFDLALAASSLVLVLGLSSLYQVRLEPLHTPGVLAFGLGLLLVLSDVGLLVQRLLDADRTVMQVASAALGVAAVAAFLVFVLRLGLHLRLDKLRARARGLLALLFAWTAFAAATAVVNRMPDGDLRWLSWPFGFATAGLGLGLWIGLLWLTRDTQEALRP